MLVNAMLRLSQVLKKYIDMVGKFGSFFIMPLVFVTIWDVAIRKLGGFQYWLVQNFGTMFESTKIQEWEWHFHTLLFFLVLGYGYVNNRHVRVDLLREKMSLRRQAWIEFWGCLIFLIPFCLLIAYYGSILVYDSYLINEQSASTVGLCCRWMIRSVLVIGITIAALSGVAIWLQSALVLFGPKELRFELYTLSWPEETTQKTREM